MIDGQTYDKKVIPVCQPAYAYAGATQTTSILFKQCNSTVKPDQHVTILGKHNCSTVATK